MKKTFTPDTHLPSDPVERVKSVVAVCISIGYVNRNVLAKYYDLTPLQASILLREFLQALVNDVRRDVRYDGYSLLSHPHRHENTNYFDPH